MWDMKKPDIQAVVVLSGGQDSATCLALATKKHGADRVAAITFSYGQRHAVETVYATTDLSDWTHLVPMRYDAQDDTWKPADGNFRDQMFFKWRIVLDRTEE